MCKKLDKLITLCDNDGFAQVQLRDGSVTLIAVNKENFFTFNGNHFWDLNGKNVNEKYDIVNWLECVIG